MKTAERHEWICTYIDEHNFATIAELSRALDVSEMTIRRDLEFLGRANRLRKTIGGAVSLRGSPRENGNPVDRTTSRPVVPKPHGLLADRVDALVVTVANPKYEGLLPSQPGKRLVPIIAESQPAAFALTTVTVDNYQGGFDLGKAIAQVAQAQFSGQAHVLDLTYHETSTLARSQGFMAGLRSVIPGAELVLSLNAQARYETAYQLTHDALLVHPQVNIIFGINDATAWGAIKACEDLSIDPKRMVIAPFGLEGATLRNSLLSCDYCQVGLAMFPEIVGEVCLETVIAAFNQQPLSSNTLTPYAIVSENELKKYYTNEVGVWQLRCEAAKDLLHLPFDLGQPRLSPGLHLPQRIGFILTYGEHEWYQNLIASMRQLAQAYGIEIEVVDAEETLKDEVEHRRREIARQAARVVQVGDTLLLDNGPITPYLAEELNQARAITIITNSLPALNILAGNPEVVLISTGGVLRRGTQSLVGPGAEAMLREIRASKLFLQAEGVSGDFGLSQSNVSEVTIKQKMIQSARKVILLADHTCFGRDEVAQITGLGSVHEVISDDALPASYRLELNQLGIKVTVAGMG